MRLFSKDKVVEQTSSRVAKRASKMTTPDLVSWLDALVMHLGQSFDKWSKNHEEAEELDMVIESINVIWLELKSRD